MGATGNHYTADVSTLPRQDGAPAVNEASLLASCAPSLRIPEIPMKILVLCGSARKHGNSNTLADSFIRGAEEAGHEVSRLDCSRLDVHQCLGCWKCGMNGPCVQKDDFEKVRDLILPADAVVFVSPM